MRTRNWMVRCITSFLTQIDELGSHSMLVQSVHFTHGYRPLLKYCVAKFCGRNEMTLRVWLLLNLCGNSGMMLGDSAFVDNEFRFYLTRAWSHALIVIQRYTVLLCSRKTKAWSHRSQRRCCCCCLPRARIWALSCYSQSQRLQWSILIFTTLWSLSQLTMQKGTLQRCRVQDLLRNFRHRWLKYFIRPKTQTVLMFLDSYYLHSHL